MERDALPSLPTDISQVTEELSQISEAQHTYHSLPSQLHNLVQGIQPCELQIAHLWDEDGKLLPQVRSEPWTTSGR